MMDDLTRRKEKFMINKEGNNNKHNDRKNNRNKSRNNSRNNAGSIAVEMCFVCPIVICVVFFAINLFVICVNDAIAMGIAYSTMYTKEMYIVSDEDLSSVMYTDMENDMTMAADLEVKAWLDETPVVAGPIQNLKGFKSGDYRFSLSYSTECPGMFAVLKNNSSSTERTGAQEIRDTSNNLRRWQMYGEYIQ